MYSKGLNKLIKAALYDGIVTDKEREVIHKKAISEGVNPDEIDVLLDQELQIITEKKKKKKRKNIFLVTFFIFTILLILWAVIPKIMSNTNKHNGSYQEAARAYDFEAAHRILDQLQNDYLSETLSYYENEKKEKYDKAFDYVFNVEVKYLCAQGDEESMKRIIYLMSDIPVDGIAIPDGTRYIYSKVWEKKNSHDRYIKYATRTNKKCDNLVDLAIANHNYSLVESILPFYKSIPDALKESKRDKQAERENYEKWKKKGINLTVIDPIYIENVMSYSDADKKMAIAKINKAIDDGVFPNVTEHLK